uniref:Uncharacterized protein n=1 Tax=Trichobilharzia regenti TaxID=157069 RepID=A0AA85IKP2_TRIRE|nr:unnamed protein product [Trichobilharzia regenti]
MPCKLVQITHVLFRYHLQLAGVGTLKGQKQRLLSRFQSISQLNGSSNEADIWEVQSPITCMDTNLFVENSESFKIINTQKPANLLRFVGVVAIECLKTK